MGLRLVVDASLSSGAPDSPYTDRVDYDVDGNSIYEGCAVPGSATSAAVWCIKKNTWVAGNRTVTQWANGKSTYENVWDNRASLTYK